MQANDAVRLFMDRERLTSATDDADALAKGLDALLELAASLRVVEEKAANLKLYIFSSNVSELAAGLEGCKSLRGLKAFDKPLI